MYYSEIAKNSKVYRISEGYALAKAFEQIDVTYPDLKRYSFTHVTQLQSDYRFKYYRDYAGTVQQYKEEFESKCKPMLDQLSKYKMTEDEKYNYILDNAKQELAFQSNNKLAWKVDTKQLDEKGLKTAPPTPGITIEIGDVIACLFIHKLIGIYDVPGNSFATDWKLRKEASDVTIDEIKEAKISTMKEYYDKKGTYSGFDWYNKSTLNLGYKYASYSDVTPELMKLGSMKKLLKRLGL